MPTVTDEIRILIKAETAKAVKGMQKVNKQTDLMAKRTKDLTKVKKEFGSVLKMGAVALVGIGFAMKKVIDMASDLEETTSKFATVFEGNMEIANNAVLDLTDSYAMSTTEARQYLSSMQDLLVPMGMGSELAAQMSNEIVHLSADMGSFNNLPTSQVMADIQSAMVGNFETMKKYGVILNETVVKQEAQNLGLYSGKGALDAVSKSQAAYSILLKGTKAAQGDMARTMEGYANQTKRLGANFEDLVGVMGSKMLPGATKIATALGDIFKKGQPLSLMFAGIGEIGSKSLKFVAKRIYDLNVMLGNLMVGYYRVKTGFMDYDEAVKASTSQKYHGENLESIKSLIGAYDSLKTAENSRSNAAFKGTEEGKAHFDSLKEKAFEYGQVLNNLQKGQVEGKKMSADEMKKIEDEYRTYIGEKEEDELAKEQEKYEMFLERYQGQKDMIMEIEEAHAERVKENENKAMQEKFKNINKSAQFYGQMMMKAFSSVTKLVTQISSNNVAKMTKNYNRQKMLVDLLVKDEEEKTKIMEILNYTFEQKRRRELYKSAVAQKALNIAQAVMNTALAVTAALTSPMYPASIAFAAVAAAMGAVSIATVAATPINIPAAAEGALIKGSPGGQLIQAGEGGRSELIVPFENDEVMDKVGGVGGESTSNTMNVENFYAMGDAQEMAATLDGAMYDLARQGNSMFAEFIKNG